MLRFRKSPQPRSLTELQGFPGATWANASSRDYWKQMLEDQGGLCAYCQRRIYAESKPPIMHVEHWHPQSAGTATLDWVNLLAVCPGGEHEETRERHCDKSREATPLYLHPVEPQPHDPLPVLRYLLTGRVEAEPPCADIDVLNLNTERLRKFREDAGAALLLEMRRAQWDPGVVRRRYGELAPNLGARRAPFAEALRYLLRKWARKRRIDL